MHSFRLAAVAMAAVDEVRKYSDAWAIAEDIGYREWFSYTRGLSTRLNKPAKKAKLKTKPKKNETIEFFEAKDCWFKKEKEDVVLLTCTKRGQLTDADLELVA